MAKDYQRQCPDCLNTDWKKNFASLNRGDGWCAHCGGSGVYAFNTCTVCNGTKQCQTCGGSGYEYYDDDNYNVAITTNNERSDNSSSDGYYDYSSTRSTKTDADSSGCITAIFGALLVFAIVIGAVFIFSPNNTTPTNSYQVVVPTQQETPLCQADNTGECTFVNENDDSVDVIITSGLWHETYRIAPHESSLKTIPANTLPYEYDYFYVFAERESGRIQIKECESQKLVMKLPPKYWYTLGPEW